MSLNISMSRYVRVYNPSIQLDISDKIIFADLRSSRKTRNVKVNKETGEVVINQKTGEPMLERMYSRWKGKFVGAAFEAAKGLRNGATIDILNGWIVDEPHTSADGSTVFYDKCVYISAFSLSDIGEGDDSSTVIDNE